MVARIDRTGEINYNSFGSKMEIITYRNARDIDVYFEEYDWIYYNIDYKGFKKGQLKCPYEPRTCNIGYLGEGKYGKYENNKNTKNYDGWRNMLKRCYNPKDKQYSRYGGRGVTVCDNWLNFQNYAEWRENNFYQVNDEKMQLDKDILFKGNKIYSPETCIFVPQRINELFVKSDKTRGDLPIGVRQLPYNKFQAYYNNYNGKFISLGVYDTPEEAFLSYKQFKENLIKQVADEYKPYIPKELYEAMYRYEVEIDD